MAGAKAVLARHRNLVCIESLAQAAAIGFVSDLFLLPYALVVPSLVWGAARGIRATWVLYILDKWDAAADCVLTEDDSLLDVRIKPHPVLSLEELQTLYTNTVYNYLTNIINDPLQLMLLVGAAAAAVSCGMKTLAPLWYYNVVPWSVFEFYAPIGGTFACGVAAVYSADKWLNQKQRAKEFEEQCLVVARAIEEGLESRATLLASSRS